MLDVQRILIVEDDPATRQGLQRFLEGAGLHVTAVGACRPATALLGGEDFDTLITDLDLPDGTGLELVVQARRRNPELRAILMTAYGCTAVRKRVRELGLAGYFEKPIAPEAMLAVVTQETRMAEPSSFQES